MKKWDYVKLMNLARHLATYSSIFREEEPSPDFFAVEDIEEVVRAYARDLEEWGDPDGPPHHNFREDYPYSDESPDGFLDRHGIDWR